MFRNKNKQNNQPKLHKARRIALIGGTDSGKTSLVHRIIKDTFDRTIHHTIGVDYYTKEIETANANLKLHLFDTAGADRFKFITPKYCKDADLIIGVFDVTNPESLKELNQKIIGARKENQLSPIILIGTKMDLKSARVINDAAIEEFKDNNGIAVHYLISSREPTFGKSFTDLQRELAKHLLAMNAVCDSDAPCEFLIGLMGHKIAQMESDIATTHNDKLLMGATRNVILESISLLANTSNPKDIKALQTTLRNVYNVLINPTSKTNIETLQQDTAKSTIGRPVLWKKLTGAILIFLGAVVAGLSAAAIPFTAGLSGSGIAGGCLVIAAGALLFRSGMQKSISKHSDQVCKVAKANYVVK